MGDDRKKAWSTKVKKGAKTIVSPLKPHPSPTDKLNEPISMNEDWLADKPANDSTATDEE